MRFASDWLKRSAGLALLYVRLRWHHSDREPMGEVVNHSAQRTVETVASHAHRLKILDIQLTSKPMLHLSTSFSSKILGSLEHLKLSLPDSDGSDVALLKLNASSQVLTMEYGWLTQIVIDWSRLTQFVGQDLLNLEECVYLFQHAPNLTFCNIDQFAAASHPGRRVNHLSLETLLINNCDTGFWESFAFPSLNTLHVCNDNGALGWNRMKDLVLRSGCKIIQLVVRQMEEGDEDEIIEVFKATTQLERLSVKESVLRGSLLLEMDAAASLPPSAFLCKLQVLTLALLKLPFHWPDLVVF